MSAAYVPRALAASIIRSVDGPHHAVNDPWRVSRRACALRAALQWSHSVLPQSALKSMNVMFATPCYISAVTMNYVTSIFSMTLDAGHLGLPCILHMHSESLITRGRNNMV